jgi:uncharacterized membrane protein (UPF0127 family)
MMIQRFKTLFVSLAAALAFSAYASAQIDLNFDGAMASDPTAPDAVVEYGGPEPLVIETSQGQVEFIVELAETQEARTRGMMHRESMEENEGMLFDFEVEQVTSIWMRNTMIPLDIIFIRADGTIAKIVANAVPYSLRPMYSDYPVVSVLEIAGGRTAALGIEPGDLVRHDWFGTVETAPTDTDTQAVEDAGEAGPAPVESEVEPAEGG